METESLRAFIAAASYPGIAGLMLLESIVVPLPAETFLLVAGFVAAEGQLSFAGVVAAATGGSVLGNLPLFWVGRRLGRGRIRRWFRRHGSWLLVEPEQLDRGFDWMARRRGAMAVALARPLPGISSLIAIPAGAGGLSVGRFSLGVALGATVWNAAVAAFGYYLGEDFRHAEIYLSRTLLVMFTTVALGVLWQGLNHLRRARTRAAERVPTVASS